MNLKELIEKSNLQIDKDKILYNEPMSKHTTFKIGGPAECFIKIDNNDVESVCISDKHDKKLANNIMRLIQDKYKNKMYISVKFQKK